MTDMQEQIQDQEIIRQVLLGRQQSYAMLVERYQHFVFTLVLRYVPGREEAEEVAQDVFVKAYRCLADFRGESKFSTWLYTIVHSTCVSFIRKAKAPVVLVDGEKIPVLAERSGMAQPGTGTAEQRSEKKMVEAAIRQLPETDARVISLFYQHEQTLEEIGTILGMTPNNVKVRLFRARQKLKDILQQHFPAEIPYL